jgi:hypothetical protein
LVEKTAPGIYTVSGDILPIQVIDSSRLPTEENLWLKSLTNKLDSPTFSRLSGEITRQGKEAQISAYCHVITQANPRIMKETIEMGKKLTLEKVLEDAGWIEEWEARGEVRGRAEGAVAIAQNMVNLGFPVETVVSATQLDLEKVKTLYQGA